MQGEKNWIENEGGEQAAVIIITTPTKTLQPWEEVLVCLSGIDFNGFNGEIAWLQDNKRGAGQILNYLEENECSADAQGFALQALDAFMNEGEVDGLPNKFGTIF